MISDYDLKTWCKENQVYCVSWDCSAPIMERINYVFFKSLISLFIKANKTANIREIFAFLNDNSPKSVFKLIDEDIRTHLLNENIPYYIYDMNKAEVYENSYLSIYNSDIFYKD